MLSLPSHTLRYWADGDGMNIVRMLSVRVAFRRKDADFFSGCKISQFDDVVTGGSSLGLLEFLVLYSSSLTIKIAPTLRKLYATLFATRS
jgi:hypothetical protein